ncbi:MAG: hypothetical protein P8Z67_02360 [Gammaproteobacteria bacterium]
MFSNPANWSIVGGLVLGAVFGLAVWHQRMCLVAAVGNASLVRDYRYAIAFALAILIAITGTQLLDLLHISRLAGRLPRQRALIGVQPQKLDWGDAPTDAVAAAIPRACEQALQLIKDWNP